MEFVEFKNIFLEELEKNNLNLKEEKIKVFYEYMLEILDWNEKINVTAIKDEREFIRKHFIDSLTVCRDIKDGESVIDIGTGAGFPGIPIKIINDNSKVTLIDSVNKKLNVIRNVSKDIKLQNLEIIHTRAEDLANKEEYREKFDVVTTRAVSNFSTIAEYMLPFVKIGGKAICMKGPNFKEELETSKKAINVLGGEISSIRTEIISEDFERNIIIIKKVKNTPKKFPRGQGKPLKEPIC